MKWSGQMVLGSDAAGSSNDGPVPMEVDRIESKGKHKGGSKGKTKDKNSSKGKRKKKRKRCQTERQKLWPERSKG